jgi:hypothetical protein
MKEKDYPPTIRVDLGNGRAIYPQFTKNTKGKWELKDKSFQKLIMSQYGSKKHANSSEERFGSTFFVLTALMLPAIWQSIEMYFLNLKARRAMRFLDTVPREHLIGIVVNYLKNHPEKFNEPSINLIIEDLHQAFPSA